jgi:hypothetical protein
MQPGTSTRNISIGSQQHLADDQQQEKNMALAALQRRLLNSLTKGIGMDGLHYHHADLDVDIRLGKTAQHACEYRLLMTDTYLGEIRFTRERRFTEQELELIEALIPRLVEQLKSSLEAD